MNIKKKWEELPPTPARSPVEGSHGGSQPGETRMPIAGSRGSSGSVPPVATRDWLVDPEGFTAGIYRGQRQGEIIMENGLVRRRFLAWPNCATIGYENLVTGQELIRSVRPEARVILDGVQHDIGGLQGQEEHGYLLEEWLDDLASDPGSFHLVDFEVKDISARFPWKRCRPLPVDVKWPPAGKELVFFYGPPAGVARLEGITVQTHYEIYDGIPLISKWITMENRGKSTVRLDSFTSEILAVVDFKPGTQSEGSHARLPWPHLYFESDYSFRGMDAEQASQVMHWKVDPLYTSQVAYANDDLILFEARLPLGPAVDIESKAEHDARLQTMNDRDDESADTNSTDGGNRKPGRTRLTRLHGLVPWADEATWEPATWQFEGFRLYELALDGGDRERCGLARRRMYRTIAPWVMENPLMFHLTSFEPGSVREAMEQMEATGFELLIFSFGSGFNTGVLELGIEHPDWVDDMVEEVKGDIIDPVREKGFDVGGYSLLASRKISIEDDVVNPYTGRTSDVESPQLEPGIEAIQGFTGQVPGGPTFGNSPCLGSKWGLRYFQSLHQAFEKLGLTFLEHDGSYPGDVCASTKHPGHRDLYDSQWMQWKMITSFYKWCRSRGIFLNVPDWYMLSGSNKTGIGYKEVNWSLPRARQVILGRQNMYDGTWEKRASMGWTFCPLTRYHAVKEYPPEVATIEPLHEHLDHYERMLSQNLGYGVQACYRGTRIYDVGETKGLVKKWVDWYKHYRPILESDIIHVRRPDGRHVDGILHVDPTGTCRGIKGMALFFNPTSNTLNEDIWLDLYYTGISVVARVKERDAGDEIEFSLDRHYRIKLPVKVPPGGMNWYVIY